MAKLKEEKKESELVGEAVVIPAPEVLSTESKEKLSTLSVDFPNEGLNNVVKKINEIINYLNK